MNNIVYEDRYLNLVTIIVTEFEKKRVLRDCKHSQQVTISGYVNSKYVRVTVDVSKIKKQIKK